VLGLMFVSLLGPIVVLLLGLVLVWAWGYAALEPILRGVVPPEYTGWAAAAVAVVLVVPVELVLYGVAVRAEAAARADELRSRAAALVADAANLELKDRLALQKDRLALEKDLIQAQNAVRATLVQVFTGLAQLVLGSAVIGTLLLQGKNVQIAQKNLEGAQTAQSQNLEVAQTAQRQNAQVAGQSAQVAGTTVANALRTLDLSEQGQAAERFTRAIEQLGSTASDGSARAEIRLGGIYALERIATDWPQNRPAIMDVLSTLVRREARGPQLSCAPAPDDRKVLEADKRQERQRTDAVLELTLRALGRLNRVHWDELAKSGRSPIDPPTVGNDVRKTDLSKTDLQGFNLTAIDLIGAYLQDADLAGAILRRANLQDADLRCAYLEEANLTEAQLQRAQLQGAHLQRAQLQDANLTGANLTGANLTGARNLTPEQVLQAYQKGKDAALPEPPLWTKEEGDRVRRQW
jgi:Pentapeptide repeats (8 copies)